MHNKKLKTYTTPVKSAQNVHFSDTSYTAPRPLWTLTKSLTFSPFPWLQSWWFSLVAGPRMQMASSVSVPDQPGAAVYVLKQRFLSLARQQAPPLEDCFMSSPQSHPSLTWSEWKLKTPPQLLKFSWVSSLLVPWCLPLVILPPSSRLGSYSGTRCCLCFPFCHRLSFPPPFIPHMVP